MFNLHAIHDARTDTLTLRLEGNFNRVEARELHRRVVEADAAKLVIDFSRVRTFEDTAIPTVIRAVGQRPCRLTGLGRHQERMFRYLGMAGTGRELETALEAVG
ncbi:MAG TPA: STAS domain-containing protein [Myxococcaceae bacterium]|nr:STAS domain-containing protein [Myxococcaceae bacterium]